MVHADSNMYPEPHLLSQEPQGPKQIDVSKRLKCKHRGCPNRTGFGRKAEPERHVMACHAPKGDDGKCPMLDCDKSYPRRDKFRLHLMKNHSIDDLGVCPNEGCDNPGPYPLDLLRVHEEIHLISGIPRLYQPAYLLTNFKKFNHSCLIGSCKKMVKHDKLQAHLLSHNVNQRREHRDAIEKWGYEAVTMRLICPVCGEHSSDRAQFARHIKESHLPQPKDVVTSSHVCIGYFMDRYREGKYRQDNLLGIFEYTGDPESFGFSQEEDRMLGELYPWRRELLRLLPDICFHIMFQDVWPKKAWIGSNRLNRWGFKLIKETPIVEPSGSSRDQNDN
ncbi:hypothetical protein P154DRAFT_563753 [Amniculicola lignicola CBS 123094]|uniref:C2H2-type domain-containing protein n=1 Tax=Amniculicola lignicola CBS 123094 TaxID=1392246 RepID=A0A6A5WDG5_9PLEO|nr:hypothetical protein P154DRAFT_563753 [Amniculicola lignicola CBS 123094]